MADDERPNEGSETENQAGASGGEQPASADAGEPQAPSQARDVAEARDPSEEDLDARQERIRLTRKPMGPPPVPEGRGGVSEPEPEPEDVPETNLDGVTGP